MNNPFIRKSTLSDLRFLERKEHFIPFRISVLLEKMLLDPRLAKEEHEMMRAFSRKLGDRFHYEYRVFLESLKSDFVPFDPDRDTLGEPAYTDEELETIRLRLYYGVRKMLSISNYVEMTDEQLEQCLRLQPIGGLSVHVDTDDFDEFHVFYRSIRRHEQTERFFFFWKRTRPVVSFSRVFVLARFKDETGGRLIMKIFKDVAVENIKIVAPKVKLGMPVFDRIKIGGTVLGSLATTIYKLLVAAALSWILFFVVLSGLVLAAFKGVMSFLNSKTKYLHVFSSSLYYRNISNNKAALTTLIDAAEEQEIKEALLAYYILHIHRERKMTLPELDLAAEHWIGNHFGHQLDFEVDDAVRKLAEKKILFDTEQVKDASDQVQTIYHACSLPEALQRLDLDWTRLHNDE